VKEFRGSVNSWQRCRQISKWLLFQMCVIRCIFRAWYPSGRPADCVKTWEGNPSIECTAVNIIGLVEALVEVELLLCRVNAVVRMSRVMSDETAGLFSFVAVIGVPVHRNGQPHSTPVWCYEAGSSRRSGTTASHCSVQGNSSPFLLLDDFPTSDWHC